MKFTIVLVVSLTTILAIAQAQENPKVKGDPCKENSECGGGLKCVEEVCGCKQGHLPMEESHAQGTGNNEGNVWVCRKVVGVGCDHDSDCNVHLDKSKCDPKDHVCVCKKEDYCKDGAMTLTVMSLTTMMAVVVALLKIW